MNTNEYVLHLDLIGLAPDATPEAREALIASAGELATLSNVERVGVIEADAPGDFDLAFFFVLRGFASLEPFGTDPTYAAFLQTRVAPLLRGLAGADVRLENDFPAMARSRRLPGAGGTADHLRLGAQRQPQRLAAEVRPRGHDRPGDRRARTLSWPRHRLHGRCRLTSRRRCRGRSVRR